MVEANGKKNKTCVGMTYEQVRDNLTRSINDLERGTVLVVVIDVVWEGGDGENGTKA